jgi:type IV secretion system protein VirD4
MKNYLTSLPARYKLTGLSVLFIGALLSYGWISGLLFGFFEKESSLPSPWHTFFLLLNFNFNSTKTNILLGLSFIIPMAIIIVLWVSNYERQRLTRLFGDAHFASFAEIKKMGLLNKYGLIIGEKYGRLLQAKLVSHALIFAPSRSGKGVSQVMPNALTFKDSMLVIDMKQEIFNDTSGFRKAKAQEVYLFAPANLDGKTHCWNPLDLVSDHPSRLISDLQLIVSILIPKNKEGNTMWVDEARAIAVGLLLWLKDSGRPFTIGELALLVKGTPDFSGFLRGIIEGSIAGNELKNLHPIAFMNINNFVQKAVKEQSGVKSTLTSKLNLWDDPLIHAATQRSDFDIRQMRKKRMTVYLGIPTNQLTRLAPLMNLFIQLFINAMTENLPQKNEPYKVLAMLDEFCALGRLDTLKNGFGFLAGYNIHLMAIIQNIGQFYELYDGRDNCDVFFQNTDYKICYRQNTKTDQEFISNQLGTCTVENHSKSYPGGLIFNQTPSTNKSLIQRPLLTPNEVRIFPKEEGIAIINGESPVRFKRVIHYQDKRFKERILPPIQIPQVNLQYPLNQIESSVKTEIDDLTTQHTSRVNDQTPSLEDEGSKAFKKKESQTMNILQELEFDADLLDEITID